jgi:NTP pyrophosphatase (non-canonical NTP hydrolase)
MNKGLHAMYVRDYELAAKETASYKDKDYLPLGLAEETGELIHEYARCKRKGVKMDIEALKSEVGDVVWVLSQICRENGFWLEEAMSGNIEKLSKRDGEGTLHLKGNR